MEELNTTILNNNELVKRLKEINELHISNFQWWNEDEQGNFDNIFAKSLNEAQNLAIKIEEELEEANPDYYFVYMWSEFNAIECFYCVKKDTPNFDFINRNNLNNGSGKFDFAMDLDGYYGYYQ